MKKAQINSVLNLVQKPARYINHELNSYNFNVKYDFSIVLCFPDIYEIGASNLGIEILYHLINEKRLARCERVFSPGVDMENILRKNNLNLFSLETKTELRKFDILGFTIQCELVGTNIINILDLSNIPIFSKDRGKYDPIIIAGGPALTNPEPFCDFFDMFVIGDGEDVIVEIINICKKSKRDGCTRRETLEKLSFIDGVYIPSFYDVKYNDDNTIKEIIPLFKHAKSIINKKCSNFEYIYAPKTRIVPFIKTIHNRLSVEITRGCLGKCRFCQAARYYSPWRQRSIKKTISSIKKGLELTGFEEISLSSLSCSDYEFLDDLLIKINNLCKKTNFNISIPSLRCNKRSLKIMERINNKKKPTLTFAIEAGSNRLRNVIGKYLSEKQIFETISAAKFMGWKVIKLYFMIGLPTETHNDIICIEKLIKTMKKQLNGLNFTITISPFIPKAHTAFQWTKMDNINEINKKISYLLKSLPANIKINNRKSNIVESLIARGDRRLSNIIYKAWIKGARFDQWDDKFNYEIWNDVFNESELDFNFYLYRDRFYNEILPWDHLYFGMSKKKLYDDYIFAINKKESAVNKTFIFNNNLCVKNINKKNFYNKQPVMRLIFKFSKKGIIKFVSHLEQVEIFKRIFRMSNLPVAFTCGFNSKIKLSYGPPLHLGHESSSEYFELYFIKKIDIKDIKNKLLNLLPHGFKLITINRIPLSFPSIDTLINVVKYKIRNINIIQKDINRFMSYKKVLIKKIKNNKINEINIIPIIKKIYIESQILNLQLCFEKNKNINPEIFLEKIFEINKKKFNKYEYLIERVGMYIETKNGITYEL
ncbi:MAG: TIGR03960 family B12-binding radical SAM protein [Endomicrobium sp.]|jgi:radical SAM family uncharacterized protein/radical SAM-linked protein|nr:TIGR03960 family B12-binding radical SAM protein [Endomicrobium sp.]